MKLFLINLLKQIKNFMFYNYFIIRNRNLDYFKYNKLSVKFPIFTFSKEPGIIGNKCYGNLKAIKNATGSNFEKNCLIEHGLYFGEYVIENECNIKGLKTIYTYGQYRLNSLNKSNVLLDKNINVIPIGPYIVHAKNFCSPKKQGKIKEKYGKILLVFPFHSSAERETKFNERDFIKKIQDISKDYDSVFVSMFWLDIVYQNHQLYLDAGFKIVTSGHRNDPYFLRRLRDLINLSDMTMSNEIGTHIGYCISLGKPHFLYSQEIISEDILNKPTDKFDENYKSIVAKERQKFIDIFCNEKPLITSSQIKLVKFYWGEYK